MNTLMTTNEYMSGAIVNNKYRLEGSHHENPRRDL